MSTAAIEVLDMLSRNTIDIDEAIRLLNAIKRSAGRKIRAIFPASAVNESEVLMEVVGAATRPQHGYGNIIMR